MNIHCLTLIVAVPYQIDNFKPLYKYHSAVSAIYKVSWKSIIRCFWCRFGIQWVLSFPAYGWLAYVKVPEFIVWLRLRQ